LQIDAETDNRDGDWDAIVEGEGELGL